MMPMIFFVVMNSSKLRSAYFTWLLDRPSFAITLTFNWLGDIAARSAEQKIREFGAFIDRARLGKRFYRKPAEARTKFMLIPEKFSAGYPHYHGVIQCPLADGSRTAPHEYQAAVEDAWRAVAPSGTIRLEPIHDADGWAHYVTKETGMNYDGVVHSFDHWSSKCGHQ
jgi:hypothetical protein